MTFPKARGSGATVIVGELRTAIESGGYGHNQRLPAERDLASHYGASRTTVREALRQ
ncbi:MAG: GntR family transcriptional regulator, partial [Geminicoccaceae bacterium]